LSLIIANYIIGPSANSYAKPLSAVMLSIINLPLCTPY